MVNNEVEGGQGPAGVFVQCYAGIKKEKEIKHSLCVALPNSYRRHGVI